MDRPPPISPSRRRRQAATPPAPDAAEPPSTSPPALQHAAGASGVRQLGENQVELYSHSIVAGGLLVMSYATRFTPGTSATMRPEMRASTS